MHDQYCIIRRPVLYRSVRREPGNPVKYNVGRCVALFRAIQYGNAYCIIGGTDFESEVAQSGHENIRYFNVAHYTSNQPLAEVRLFNAWQVASREVSGDFSAAAYFFAREV